MISLRRYLENRKTLKSGPDSQKLEVLSFRAGGAGRESAHPSAHRSRWERPAAGQCQPGHAPQSQRSLHGAPGPGRRLPVNRRLRDRRRFKVSKAQAQSDYAQFSSQLEEADPPGRALPDPRTGSGGHAPFQRPPGSSLPDGPGADLSLQQRLCPLL